MELFGVQELPAAKSISAPGWAYVPDTGINPSVAALQPSRAKRVTGPTTKGNAHETTAKQDAKVLRDLAALDKESHRDVQLPIPVKHRDGAGRASHGKTTPAIRKILQSQKTFVNHLADAEALAPSQMQSSAPTAALPTPASRASPASASTPVTNLKSMEKRIQKRKELARSTLLRRVSMAEVESASSVLKGVKQETSNTDVLITDVGPEILHPLPQSSELAPHLGDRDPLLVSHIPPVPLRAELEALIAAPPLTYMEARGELTEEDQKKPARSFCEICGYWGRVKCMKCGTRVCALECLRTHQEDCYARYGA